MLQMAWRPDDDQLGNANNKGRQSCATLRASSNVMGSYQATQQLPHHFHEVGYQVKPASCLLWRRRGFERLLRKLLRLRSEPALLILHWWAPLHFQSSFWNVAEDELDVIASYYRLQVTRLHLLFR